MEAAVRTLYAVLMVLSGTAAVCGNLLLLTALLFNKELRSDSLGLTLSFSLSDLAAGLSVIPFGVHNSLSWPAALPSRGAICQGGGFILLLLQSSSIQSLAWVAVDRFTAICFALSYRRIWTSRRRCVLLVLIWLLCLLGASLPLLGVGRYAYSESRFLCGLALTPENRPFVVVWAVGGVAAPILATCCLYGSVVYVARKQARRGTFVCNELHCFYVPANNYLRSSVVMVATSVCLLVCWLPHIWLCLSETLSGRPSAAFASALSTWLVLTSAALNPWVVCMMQRYRSAVHQSLDRFYRRCFQTPVLHLTAASPSRQPEPAAAPPQ